MVNNSITIKLKIFLNTNLNKIYKYDCLAELELETKKHNKQKEEELNRI